MKSHKWLVEFFPAKEVNYPETVGLLDTKVQFDGETNVLDNSLLVMKITCAFIVKDFYKDNMPLEIYKAQCVFEIPFSEVTEEDDIIDPFRLAERNMFAQLNAMERKMQIPLTRVPDPSPDDIHQEYAHHIYTDILKK